MYWFFNSLESLWKLVEIIYWKSVSKGKGYILIQGVIDLFNKLFDKLFLGKVFYQINSVYSNEASKKISQ